jgi:DNA-binding response OmpR family regulator
MNLLKSPRLLVIDDDPDIRDLIEVVFSDRGFAVELLSDGIDALDLRKHYDVILLDLNMPVFDGERLTDYWSLTDPAVLERLIVMTGFSHYADDRRLPVFDTISKPFELPALIGAVDKCLRNARAKAAPSVQIAVHNPESERCPEGEP